MNQPSRRARNPIVTFVLAALLVPVLAVAAATWAARWHWIPETLSLAALPATLLALFAVKAAALLRRFRIAALHGAAALALALATGFVALPTGVPAPAQASAAAQGQTSAPVRVAFLNAWEFRADAAGVGAWLQAEQPDIVAMVEARPAVVAAARAALPDHPYVMDTWGHLVISRWPLSGMGRGDTARAGLTRLDIAHPGGRVSLAMVHLRRPWPFTDPGVQVAQVAALARRLRADGGVDLMVGDFNNPPWGRPVRLMERCLGLQAMQPGLDGTWPALMPPVKRIDTRVGWPAALSIPIDQALGGAGVALSQRRVSPVIGSDHRGIAFTLRRVAGAPAAPALPPDPACDGPGPAGAVR